MSFEFDTTVFYESQGEAVARAFVLAAPRALVDPAELATWRLEGRIVGPTCRYSSTLQARIPLAHRGLTTWGDRLALLAEAAVPDPCSWSTELPFLYRAIGDVVVGPATRAAFEQPFGLRRLSIVRRRIALEGRLWVPRVVRREAVVEPTPLESWRAADTALFVDDPDEALCRAADETGVVLFARAPQPVDDCNAALQRYGTHPSIAVVELPAAAHDPAPANLARNTLVAYGSDSDTDAPRGAPRIVELEPAETFVPAAEAPLFIRRKLTTVGSLAEARAGCDRLQADLAGKCEAAGFIV